jgi:uncharacterized protein YndB with AHSA1/START domain
MISREEDGIWCTLKETIAAHHEIVFDALTSESGLTRWLPVAAEVDLRQGGLIVFGWDAKMRRRTTIAILDYDPGGRIVWDWYVDHSDVHAPVYWSVDPSVEEGSLVTLRQGPFKDDPESLITMATEAETWRWYLCNLRTTLEARHDMRKVKPL